MAERSETAPYKVGLALWFYFGRLLLTSSTCSVVLEHELGLLGILGDLLLALDEELANLFSEYCILDFFFALLLAAFSLS